MNGSKDCGEQQVKAIPSDSLYGRAPWRERQPPPQAWPKSNLADMDQCDGPARDTGPWLFGAKEAG